MTAIPTPSDSAADDPRVREAYVDLLLAAIADARDTIATGIPQVKGPILARLLAVAATSIKSKSDNEELASLRRELTAFYESMREGLQ